MTYGVSKRSAIVLGVAGLLGLLASFALTYDVIKHSADAGYVPPCSINPVLSCVSVMKSAPSTFIGDIPNSLFGLVGFSMLVAFAALLLTGAKVAKTIWRLAFIAAIMGFGFVHYLVYESVFQIQSLCPWCMVVWSITPLVFYVILMRNIRLDGSELSGVVKKILPYRYLLLASWYVVVIVLIGVQFWHYWQTLLP